MLIKILLIAVISSFLLSCGTNGLPAEPEIKNHYYLNMDCKRDSSGKCLEILNLTCYKYDISSFSPYTLVNTEKVDLTECDSVGGYKADDFIKLKNWQTEVLAWAKENKKCFKGK